MASRQDAKAAILCDSVIVRSAIENSLINFGINCESEPERADVIIVVSGMLSDRYDDMKNQAEFLQKANTRQWVILGKNENDPFSRQLKENGRQPCRIPEDIDGDDLGHIVSLAASGHMIAINRFCPGGTEEDVEILSKANLDRDQWKLMRYLSKGLSNKEIAIAEDTTESAIKARLRLLLQKLGLNNRTKAAVLAARCRSSEIQS